MLNNITAIHQACQTWHTDLITKKSMKECHNKPLLGSCSNEQAWTDDPPPVLSMAITWVFMQKPRHLLLAYFALLSGTIKLSGTYWQSYIGDVLTDFFFLLWDCYYIWNKSRKLASPVWQLLGMKVSNLATFKKPWAQTVRLSISFRKCEHL